MGAKKAIVTLTVLIVITIIGFLIYQYFFYPQKMISIPREEITDIRITNGLNGNISELDSKGIDELYNICSSISLTKTGKADSTGWAYYMDIYKGKEVHRVTLVSGNRCTISALAYSIEDKKGAELINFIERMCK